MRDDLERPDDPSEPYRREPREVHPDQMPSGRDFAFDEQARSSTPSSTPARVSDLAKIPDHIRHACTPEQLLVRIHGVTPGWRCPRCNRPFELADFALGKACPHCRRPLPVRCATRGCGGLCEPFGVSKRSRIHWYAPRSVCADCETNATHVARAAYLTKIIPKATLEGALAWQPDIAWRRLVSSIVETWRKGVRNVTMLYVSGPNGTGKSVAAAFACRRLHQETGGAISWQRERDLLNAHRDRYSDDEALARAGTARLLAAKSAEITVIDELWVGGPSSYTERQVETVWEILDWRVEQRLPTVLVSNTPYQPDPANPKLTVWHLVFNHAGDGKRGDAMASRFGQVGEPVEANGRDRRLDHLRRSS